MNLSRLNFSMISGHKKDSSFNLRLIFSLILILALNLAILFKPPASPAADLTNLFLQAEQNSIPPFPDRPDQKFLRKTAGDLVGLAAAPFNWRGADWQNFSLCLVAGGSLLPVDNSIHLWMRDLQPSNSALIKTGKFFSTAGSPLALLGLVTGGYLAGELAHSSSTRQTFLLLAESLFVTEIYVQFLKSGVGRARPYTEEGPFRFHPLNFKEKWHSFPSGHAAAAWAVAGSLSATRPDSLLSASAIMLASAISISRLILDQHYPSDVLLGSLLGYFIGKKIASPGREDRPLPHGGIRFFPALGPGFIAVCINLEIR